MIEPHLPPAHGTGRPRSWPMREIVNGIFYVMRAGCPWRLLPSDATVGHDLSLGAKFRDTASLRRSITLWSWPTAGRTRGQPERRDYRQPERQDDRGWWPPAEAGKKIKGRRQSTPTGAASCLRRSGEYPGPRWRRAAAVRLTRLVSVHREDLCRQRLRRREGRHGHRDRRRDRAQKPRSGRLRRPTAPLGRGALLRLDQPQPATGKGLRGHHRLGPRLPLRLSLPFIPSCLPTTARPSGTDIILSQ